VVLQGTSFALASRWIAAPKPARDDGALEREGERRPLSFAAAVTPLAELDDLRVRFGAGPGAMEALRGVSLHVMPGAVLCPLDESGSGKRVPLRALLRHPAHPYTRDLLTSTACQAGVRQAGVEIAAIPGAPPDMQRPPPGCAFAPRCFWAAACTVAVPGERAVAPGRTARCIRMGKLVMA